MTLIAGLNQSQPAPAVLELPGLYGPFTFPEKLLQKIWLRRNFDSARARTTRGEAVVILHPGKWNLLGGPDFKNARLRFGDGPEVTGDIELHLHANDWAGHRHANDTAYNGVILHVVLFVPSPGHITRGHDGGELPVLALLPLLHHDLEEYAAEDAVEALANRPATQIVERLGLLPPAQLSALLNKHASERWRQKVHYARLRIERLGWTEACHQTAMEILGYRFNRAAMLRVAAAFPLAIWDGGTVDPETAFQSGGDWSLQGLRPANQPRVRLRQYIEWTKARRDWPERLAKGRVSLPAGSLETDTGTARKELRMTAFREALLDSINGGAVHGTRFDTLVCDGFLPLLAAKNGCDVQGLWFHWFAGDVPPEWRHALRQLEMFAGRLQPACHGLAQGLLGWLIEQERSARVSAGHRA